MMLTKLKLTNRQNNILKISLIVIAVGGTAFFRCYLPTRNQKIAALSENTSPTISQRPTTEASATTQKSESVCLDPGHGGSDMGASYGNIIESAINLTVAKKVALILENDGYKVYMTRTTDEFVAKRSRAYYCNSVNASVLVAIHHNSYDSDSSVNYSTALYYKASDQALASSILESNSNILNVKNQGIASFNDSELYIATMPAALSEAFFITNNEEYEKVLQTNSPRLGLEAESIAKGIENYFANPNQSSASTVAADSLIINRTDSD